MIAFLVTVYAAVVLVLFKFKLVKPQPYPISIVILAGILMIGAKAHARSHAVRRGR